MINLEDPQDGDWDAIRRIIRILARLVVDTGGRSIGIRFGTGTVTWAGGTPFATIAVTHGLGRTPVAVVISDGGGGSLAQIAVFSASGLGATTFTAAAEPTDSSSPAATTTRTFYWIAVG